jgi:fido (protein-threonine AMPylation protein)
MKAGRIVVQGCLYHLVLMRSKSVEILAFSVRFESIHPFQDGNGRIGRLIMWSMA